MDLRKTIIHANLLCMNAKHDWDDLRLLLAVARRGSFLQAGPVVAMVPSTLSRRMVRLEYKIGAKLLVRGSDGVRLTARGQRLVEVAEAMERALTAQGDAGDGAGATVRVSAGEGFTPIFLRALAAFRVEMPACGVELISDQRFVKIAKGAADIAVRTVHLGEPSLIYRSVTQIAFGLYASADYAATIGPGAAPHDVELIDLVPPLGEMAHMKAVRAMGFGSCRLRLSSFDALSDAVRAGMGVAVLPHVAAEGLTPMFPHIDLPPLDVYLVAHPDGLREPQIRLMFDLCCARLQQDLSVSAY